MGEKECKSCTNILSLQNFNKSSNTKDGYENKCKVCRRSERPVFKFNCVVCGVNYTTKKRTSNKCCSQRCVGALRTIISTEEVSCGTCESKFLVDKSKVTENNYCCKACFSESVSVRMSGENHHRYNTTFVECDYCKALVPKSKVQLTLTKLHFCNRDCFGKGIGKYRSGTLHHSYDHSKTDTERVRDRLYPGYKEWRSDVYKRDNYSCVVCGNNKSGNLIAHHLYSHHAHKELRLSVNNGVTVCRECHLSFHNQYGFKNNSEMQFILFLNDYAISECGGNHA